MESVGTVAEQSLMIIKPRAEILRIVFHCHLFIFTTCHVLILKQTIHALVVTKRLVETREILK